MLKRIGAVLVLTGIVAGAGSGLAADKSGNYMGHGVGMHTCVALLADTTTEFVELVGWIAGYTTAVAKRTPGVTQVISDAEPMDFVRRVMKLCETYPTESLANVLNRLIEETMLTNSPTTKMAPKARPPVASTLFDPAHLLNR